MSEQWVDAQHLRGPGDERIWEVNYSAHPLLDPDFAVRPSRLRRFFRLFFERIRGDDRTYHESLASMLHPAGSSPHGTRDLVRMAEYLREADTYVRELIDLVPSAAVAHLLLSPEVAGCDDLRDLLRLVFTQTDPRLRFEAQRKLYLAALFMQIDQSRHIQDGPRHKTYFEELLQRGLWRYARQVHEVEIGFNIEADGESIHYSIRPTAGQQRWTFRSVFLEREIDGVKVPLDVLYYNCRFKRSVEPISYEIVDGRHRVIERKRWGDMRRQSSGSIISKMIRKGVNNPSEITDVIGAMFIVHDEAELDDLLRLLDESLGHPVIWRNVVDTIADESERTRLDKHSGRGYRVFKGDVDVLYAHAAAGRPPYRFPVEIQIYTLEAYLRTVCGAHAANHLALKLRQFLYGLVPKIFPRSIYGSQWLRLQ